MTKLLYLKTSLFSDEGQSSALAERFVARWRAEHPRGAVTVRDLGSEPVPHLSAERFTAFITPPAERSLRQQAEVACSDALIADLQEADVVVLGLPMYNFGIPSALKAYFDHVARAGVTFRYTATGPQGLLAGKRVRVFAARGGSYLGTDKDTQTAYVRNFFGFLGMADIEFVYAEGLALGDDHKAAALDFAHAEVDALAV